MEKEKLTLEHAQVKERLADLVDFINSEEYYKESESKKQLISMQRTGMEMYLNSLSLQLWGDDCVNHSASSLLPLMMSAMFLPGFSSPAPNTDFVKEKLDNKD